MNLWGQPQGSPSITVATEWGPWSLTGSVHFVQLLGVQQAVAEVPLMESRGWVLKGVVALFGLLLRHLF